MSAFLVQFQHQHLLSDLPRQRWTTGGKRDHLPSNCKDASLILVVRQGGHQWDGKRGAGGESNLSDWFCATKNVQQAFHQPSLTPSRLNPQMIIEEKWEGRGRARPGG